MKRFLFNALLASVLLLGLTACSGGDNSTDSPSTPIDLTGEWVQNDSGTDSVRHVAYISNETIEVYWFFTEEDLVVPYWTGSLSDTDETTWSSINQAEWIYPQLTCTDETKQFEYKSGKLYYKDISEDSTITVGLERGEWGYAEYTAGYDEIPSLLEDQQTDNSTPSDGLTTSQRNALKTAQSYLNHSSFSYTGLISQLEYEQYSTEDAVFAADNCGADWNAEALETAQGYLDSSAFSYEGLRQQLDYEDFTQEQVQYAIDSCSADWNLEAAECAKSYLKHSSFSREKLIGQLLYEGFTQEQAEYGVTQAGY